MKWKENDETGRKRRKIEKQKFECRKKLKLVETLRPDRTGKIMAPEKTTFFYRFLRFLHRFSGFSEVLAVSIPFGRFFEFGRSETRFGIYAKNHAEQLKTSRFRCNQPEL